MINVFITCGAGASSTFLAVKLRSLSQASNLSFFPSALSSIIRATKDDIVLVASHIAKDAKVADLRNSGITVIELPEHIRGGFRAQEALDLIMAYLKRHKS